MERKKRAHYLQKNDWDCGAGVTGGVLRNAGYVDIDHAKIMKMLGTNEKDGTKLNILVKFFFSLPEFEARTKILATFEDLQAEIDKGRVCIVAYQNWDSKESMGKLDSGHYAVVIEAKDDKIRLLDSGSESGEVEFDRWDFEHRWVEIDGENDEDLYEGWMMSLNIPETGIEVV